MDSKPGSIKEGTTFEDIHGDTYTVSEVEESGQVHFEDYYSHWISEVEGFVEDELWEVVDE